MKPYDVASIRLCPGVISPVYNDKDSKWTAYRVTYGYPNIAPLTTTLKGLNSYKPWRGRLMLELLKVSFSLFITLSYDKYLYIKFTVK